MKSCEAPGFREAVGLLTEPIQQKYKRVKRNVNNAKEAVYDIVGLGALVTISGLEELLEYLATDPFPVSIRNNISIAIGEGGTLGLIDPTKAIEEGLEDMGQL